MEAKALLGTYWYQRRDYRGGEVIPSRMWISLGPAALNTKVGHNRLVKQWNRRDFPHREWRVELRQT